MVLNPDGTPNPLPIIDVYGTRRGPKLKKDDVSNKLVVASTKAAAHVAAAAAAATARWVGPTKKTWLPNLTEKFNSDQNEK